MFKRCTGRRRSAFLFGPNGPNGPADPVGGPFVEKRKEKEVWEKSSQQVEKVANSSPTREDLEDFQEVAESQELESTDPKAKYRFNIVYGPYKPNRKKKQFKEDGFLEVVGLKATVKDIDGKILNQIKLKAFVEEGAYLVFGNQECQVIDLVTDE